MKLFLVTFYVKNDKDERIPIDTRFVIAKNQMDAYDAAIEYHKSNEMRGLMIYGHEISAIEKKYESYE